jgi:hypothetical protein
MNLIHIFENLKDKFNWTMTYRRDSDIIHRYPFGALVGSKTMRKSYGKTRPTANSVQRRIPRKKKLVAWITSTCPTSVRRENYVRQLARHISVDIYGGCGHKYCGSHEQVPFFFPLKIFFFFVSCLRVRVPPSLPSKLIGFPTNAKNHFQICFVAAGHFRSSLPGRKLNLCVNIISLLFIQPIIKKKES